MRKKRGLHTRILSLVGSKNGYGTTRFGSLLLLFFVLVSCGITDGQGIGVKSISPEYAYIQEYAFSPDNNVAALIVPVGEYSERRGLEKSKIVVLDVQTFDILYASPEYTGLSPRNLQWLNDEQILFIGDETSGRSLITWELKTNLFTSTPFYHTGFAISHTGDEIVAWGKLKKVGSGFLSLSTGDLEFYTMPGLDVKDSVLVKQALDVLAAAWSVDDTSLMILVEKRKDSGRTTHTLYRINLLTGEQNLVLEDSPILRDFSWHSTSDVVAIAEDNIVSLYHASRFCFLDVIEWHSNRIFDLSWRNNGTSLVFIEDDANKSRIAVLDIDALLLSDYDCLQDN